MAAPTPCLGVSLPPPLAVPPRCIQPPPLLQLAFGESVAAAGERIVGEFKKVRHCLVQHAAVRRASCTACAWQQLQRQLQLRSTENTTQPVSAAVPTSCLPRTRHDAPAGVSAAAADSWMQACRFLATAACTQRPHVHSNCGSGRRHVTYTRWPCRLEQPSALCGHVYAPVPAASLC